MLGSIIGASLESTSKWEHGTTKKRPCRQEHLGSSENENQAPRSESVQLEVKVKFQLEEGEGLNSSQEDKIGDLKTNHLAPRQTKIRRHTVQEQR